MRNKTIYRHVGWMYGLVPCLLVMDVFKFQITKFRPYYFWMYPLVWLLMGYHKVYVRFTKKKYGKKVPKIPFYRIGRLRNYVTVVHDSRNQS